MHKSQQPRQTTQVLFYNSSIMAVTTELVVSSNNSSNNNSSNNTGNKTTVAATVPSNPFFDLSLVRENTEQQRDEKESCNIKNDSAAAIVAARFPGSAAVTTPPRGKPSVVVAVVDDGATDDDLSVSTFGSVISSTNSIVSTSSRRSVFSKYWTATGQTPAPLYRKGRSLVKQDSQKSSGSASSPPRGGVTGAPNRRSIFFTSSPGLTSFHSLPSTLEVTLEEQVSSSSNLLDSPKKSKSTSDLDTTKSSSNPSNGATTPLASCLKRDPLYSSSTGRPRAQSLNAMDEKSCWEDEETEDTGSISSSVRFDLASNDVRHFESPKEFHAEEGWVTYFH